MADYPASIYTPTVVTAGDPTTAPDHAAKHNDIDNEVVALQTELGVDPAGVDSTVKARLTRMDVVVAGVTLRFRGYGPTDPATDLQAGDVFFLEVV